MRTAFLVLGLAALVPPPAAWADGSTPLTPASNWFLPLFTKEGYRWMTLTGDSVHPVSRDRIDVANISIYQFSGDPATRVTCVLLSPEASFFPKEKRATGPGAVRVIREDEGVEISGYDWTYESAGEKISIARKARIVFKAGLTDILK